MAVLMDLPNELLQAVAANLSPLYIESFALSCKRIYGLCIYTFREHKLVRGGLPMEPASVQPVDLLRAFFRDPDLALYPTRWEVYTRDPIEAGTPEDLVDKINTQTLQGPYTTTLETKDCPINAANLVIPLLITRLMNLREIKISADWQPYLLDVVWHIVEASYDPVLRLKKPLALGRLKEANIKASGQSALAMGLAVTFAMIPTLRKLHVRFLADTNAYTYPHNFRYSGVTDLTVDGFADSSFVPELIRRTEYLKVFAHTHVINGVGPTAKLEPRRLIELLKERAGPGLLYLNIQTQRPEWGVLICRGKERNHNDLSLGSLRGFNVLRILVTCVDMFIQTNAHSEFENEVGTVQRLISWLPASLEVLVLHQGLMLWDTDDLRMLLRGFRDQKLARLPKLRLIIFVKNFNVNQMVPDDLKATFRETGVKIGYTWYPPQDLHEDLSTKAAGRLGGSPLGWIAR